APFGSLGRIPLNVLVKSRSRSDVPSSLLEYRRVAWLVRDNAISVFPSVSALAALRKRLRTGGADRSYLGYGNPLLTGPDGLDRRAWQYRTCEDIWPLRANHEHLAARVILPTSGGIDLERLRRQTALPETAAELCAVAAS